VGGEDGAGAAAVLAWACAWLAWLSGGVDGTADSLIPRSCIIMG